MMNRFNFIHIFVLCILLSGCATGAGSGGSSGASKALSVDLVKVPAQWEVSGENKREKVYSANLVSSGGANRVLLGRMDMNRMGLDQDAYVQKIHGKMVERIRGRVEMSPYAEDRVRWSNGVEGLRTLMRGELDGAVTIIEGVTLVDSKNVYFVYGLFPEKGYDQAHGAYELMLGSLSPIRGVSRDNASGVAGLMGTDTKKTDAVEVKEKKRDRLIGEPPAQFREFAWGSSKDNVKIVEGNPSQESAKALMYSCGVFLDACSVVYIFASDKLQQGAYIFEETFTDGADYLQSYAKVGRGLMEVYGDPVQRAAVWSSEELKGERARWGEALVRGDVVFGTVWKMGGAKVIHVMRSNGVGGVEHRITVNGPG